MSKLRRPIGDVVAQSVIYTAIIFNDINKTQLNSFYYIHFLDSGTILRVGYSRVTNSPVDVKVLVSDNLSDELLVIYNKIFKKDVKTKDSSTKGKLDSPRPVVSKQKG